MTRRATLVTLEIAVPVAVIAIVFVVSLDTGTYYFPPATLVVQNFFGAWLGPLLVADVLPSLGRLAAGFLIAAIAGVLIGVLLASSPLARRLTTPTIEFFRAIPPPAAIPLVIVLFGIGDLGKVLLIAAVCFFPVLLNTMDGVAGIDPTVRETSSVYRVRRLDALLHVTLPAAAPQIFAGLRISLSLALILMVISEMVASTNGIGYLVLYSQRTFAIPQMWAGIVLLGILGYLLNLLVVAVEYRVLRWHRASRQAAE